MWSLRKLLIKISLYWMAYIIDYLKKNVLSTIFEILFNDLVMKEIYQAKIVNIISRKRNVIKIFNF